MKSKEEKAEWGKENKTKYDKKWRKENKERQSLIDQKRNKKIYDKIIESLGDRYVRSLMRNAYGLKQETIKEHPELIENYRAQIKVKRLLKSIKNENNETS